MCDQALGLLVDEVGVVAEDLDDVVDVVAAFAERLAGVQRLGFGDHVPIALEQVGDPMEEGDAFADRGPRPVGLVEGTPGGVDRTLDIGVVGDIDLLDDGPVGRVDDIARRPQTRATSTPRR